MSKKDNVIDMNTTIDSDLEDLTDSVEVYSEELYLAEPTIHVDKTAKLVEEPISLGTDINELSNSEELDRKFIEEKKAQLKKAAQPDKKQVVEKPLVMETAKKPHVSAAPDYVAETKSKFL